MARSVRSETKYVLAGDYELCAEWAALAELDLAEWANVPAISGPPVRVYERREDLGPLAARLAEARRTKAGGEHRRAAANPAGSRTDAPDAG